MALEELVTYVDPVKGAPSALEMLHTSPGDALQVVLDLGVGVPR